MRNFFEDPLYWAEGVACALLRGELWTLPLSGRVANAAMGSRWRFVLYNPLSLCGMPGYSTCHSAQRLGCAWAHEGPRQNRHLPFWLKVPVPGKIFICLRRCCTIHALSDGCSLCYVVVHVGQFVHGSSPMMVTKNSCALWRTMR